MDDIKREIKITAKYIPLLAEFMATQDIRYYLNALYVEPHPDGGILLITTDGHTMAIVHDKDGKTNGEWLCELPTKIIRACSKRGSRNDLFSKPMHLHFVGNVAHVMSQDGDPNDIGLMHLETAFCKIVEGKFPDWRKVMPKKPKGLKRTCVNINYLARLQRIAKFSDTRYAEGVHLFQEEQRGVIVVRPIELPEAMVLVMPMHDDSIPAAIPAWLPLNPVQQKKAA